MCNRWDLAIEYHKPEDSHKQLTSQVYLSIDSVSLTATLRVQEEVGGGPYLNALIECFPP